MFDLLNLSIAELLQMMEVTKPVYAILDLHEFSW